MNVPFAVHNAGIGIGEHSARAYLWAEQGESGEATVDVLEGIKAFSEGFNSAASVAVPVAGALESRATSAASTAVSRGTGAYLPGASGGEGLGRLAGAEIRVSERGLNLVEQHLEQFGPIPENEAMLARLREALTQGRRISGADASFYMHEANEATLMSRGIGYDAAHTSALSKYQVSPFSVYHPDVIQTLPESFNDNWFSFWGISR